MLPKVTPFSEGTAGTTLLKIRLKKREDLKGHLSPDLQSTLPSIEFHQMGGVSDFTTDLWEFCENGDYVNAQQLKKNLLSIRPFSTEKCVQP